MVRATSPFTASEGSNWNPQYSPDGKTIAFNSNRDGWNVIYTLPAEGGVAVSISKEDMTIIMCILVIMGLAAFIAAGTGEPKKVNPKFECIKIDYHKTHDVSCGMTVKV